MPEDADARIDRLALRNAAAVRLAMAVSLAARVEPDLLRRARLLVNADVAAESDLWWSELVATQNSSGLVLDPAVADALRTRLAAPDEHDLRREAWKLVRRCHAREPDSIRLEELLNWHTVSGEPDAVTRIEELLQAAAQEYLVTTSEPTGGVRWILGALRRLPRAAVETPTAAALGAAAAVTLDGSLPDLGDAALPPDAVENWFPWLLSRIFSGMPPAEVPIILRHDALVVGRLGDEAQLLRVPPTDPLVLTAIWPEGRSTAHAELRWSPGEEIELPIASDQLQLVAINGERWTIRRRGAPEAPAGFDFSSVRATRRLGVGFERLRDQTISEIREVDGWIAIHGDAWSGKTYLLCAVLDQLEDEGTVVIQHFYGRGPAWWDEPENVIDSLVAQLDALAPGRRPSESDRPYDRLFQALSLGVPDRGRVVVALDGIPGNTNEDVKSWMFRSPFPSLVPGGARFVVTSRAGMGVRDWLEDGDPFRIVRVKEDDARTACEAYAYAHATALASALGRPDRRIMLLLDGRSGQPGRTEVELLSPLLIEAGFEVLDDYRLGALQPRIGLSLADEWRDLAATAQIVLHLVAAREPDSPRATGSVDPSVPLVWLMLVIPSDAPASPIATLRQLSRGEFAVDADHPLTPGAAVEVVEALKQVAWPFVEEIVSLGQGRVHPVRTLVDWVAARAPGTASLDTLPPTLTGAIDAAWSELEREHGLPIVQEVLPLLAVAQPGFSLSDLLWLVGADERDRATALVASLHRLHLLQRSPEVDALAAVATSLPWNVVLEQHGSTVLAAELGVDANVALRFGQPAIEQAHASIAVTATNPSAPEYVVHNGVAHALRGGDDGLATLLTLTLTDVVRRYRLDGLASLENDLAALDRLPGTPYAVDLLSAVHALAGRADLDGDHFGPALYHELSRRLSDDTWLETFAANEVCRPALRFRRRLDPPSAVRNGQVAVADEVLAVTGGITRLALTRDGEVVSWTDREPIVVANVGPVGSAARLVSAGTNVIVVDGPRGWHVGLGAGSVEPLPSPGVDASVTFLAPTSNGIVAATDDGLVRAWWQPGWRSGTFIGHRCAVTATAEHDDGFVTASEDGTVLCWSWEQAAPRLAYRGHHRPVRAVAVLDQGVVSAGDDGTVRWWSAVTGDELAVDGASGRPLTACASVGFGHQVVWGDDSGQLGSWDPATGQRHTWPGHRAPVLDLIAAGTRVISRAADGSLGVWDVGPEGEATGHVANLGTQAIVRAGDDLVLLAGGTITTAPIDALAMPDDRIGLAVDQRADFVAVAWGHELFTNLDLGSTSSWDSVAQPAPVADLAVFHHLGVARRLMWLLADGRIGTASPAEDHLQVDGGQLLAAGDQLAVVGTGTGHVALLELAGGDPEVRAVVAAHAGPVTAVAVGEGTQWASGGSDSTAKLWEQQQALATIRLHQPASHLGLSGEHLVTVTGNVVQVWSSATGGLERTLCEGPAVLALAVMGGLVAVAGADGLVRIWDVERGRLVDAVPAAEVAALAAGRNVLATIDTTGAVTVWDNVRSDVSLTDHPRVDLDASVPASLVMIPRGDDRPRMRATFALSFDRDVEIRQVEPLPRETGLWDRAWRAAIDRYDGWWEPVTEVGDLLEPRVVNAGEAVHLTLELEEVGKLLETDQLELTVQLVVRTPLRSDAMFKVLLDRSGSDIHASVTALELSTDGSSLQAFSLGLERLDIYVDARPIASLDAPDRAEGTYVQLTPERPTGDELEVRGYARGRLVERRRLSLKR